MLSNNYRTVIKLLLIISVLPLVALACGEGETGSVADTLPLDNDRPTFVMFYTDF
jgi:hypothetical protein